MTVADYSRGLMIYAQFREEYLQQTNIPMASTATAILTLPPGAAYAPETTLTRAFKMAEITATYTPNPDVTNPAATTTLT